MFQEVNFTDFYKVEDPLTGDSIEVARFSCRIENERVHDLGMIVLFPSLFERNKDDVLIKYKDFVSNTTAFAIDMGVFSDIEKPSLLTSRSVSAEELAAVLKDKIEIVVNYSPPERRPL